MRPRYEVLAHTADTGIVAYGSSLSEIFVNAAFAMFDLMFGWDDRTGSERVAFQVSARGTEELLVAWLGDLLFEAETGGLAFCEFGIDVLDQGRISGWARGIPAAGLELVGPPVKAITYHDLSVERDDRGWTARVVFDV